MRALALAIILPAAMVGGCASTVTAWKNDPLQSYKSQRSSLYAMTGDRRTAIQINNANGQRFCAESLPDAVAAYSAASKASASVEGKASGGFEDATYAGLLQTFHRTEIAEVYRQLGWNLCLAWAQGAINDAQYFGLLDKFTVGGLDAISKRAAQEQVWPTIAPVTLNVGPGGTAPVNPPKPEAPKTEAPKTEAPKPETPKPKPEIDLGDGVKLQPASSVSGYCIKAAAGYVGGTPGKPAKSESLPICT